MEAFVRKMQPESILGRYFNVFWMVKKNMNEGKKGAEKNQRKNIRTQQFCVQIVHH